MYIKYTNIHNLSIQKHVYKLFHFHSLYNRKKKKKKKKKK